MPGNVEPVAVPVAPCPADGWCWVQGPPMQVGRSGDTVHALGFRSTLLTWADRQWKVETLPTEAVLIDALLDAPDDRWAVDAAGATFHDDGTGWVRAPGDQAVVQLVRADDGSVWARRRFDVGNTARGGKLLLRDARGWQDALPEVPYDYPGGWLPVAVDDVWATGLVVVEEGGVRHAVHRFRGGEWEQVGPLAEGYAWPQDLERVDGFIRHPELGQWDGSSWQPVERRPDPPVSAAEQRLLESSYPCQSSLRVDAEHHWCGSRGQVYFGDGEVWTPTLLDPFASSLPSDRWGEVPPVVWAGRSARAAWGSGPTTIYRAVGPRLERFDGVDWTVVYEGSVGIVAVTGDASGAVWFVDDDGRLFRLNGVRVEPVSIPGASPFTAVYASEDGTLVVTTERDVLIREGQAWRSTPLAREGARILSVAGASTSALYAVERQGGRSNESWLHRFDGSAWRVVDSDVSVGMGALGAHRDEVWLNGPLGLQLIGGLDAYEVPESSIAELWVTDEALWIRAGVGPRAWAARHPR